MSHIVFIHARPKDEGIGWDTELAAEWKDGEWIVADERHFEFIKERLEIAPFDIEDTEEVCRYFTTWTGINAAVKEE